MVGGGKTPWLIDHTTWFGFTLCLCVLRFPEEACSKRRLALACVGFGMQGALADAARGGRGGGGDGVGRVLQLTVLAML